MNLVIAATVFGLIFLAELPDKTAIASLVLGTRFRPSWVLAGVAAAFTVHVALALLAGSLFALLPHRAVEGVVAALFVLGAIMVLRGRDEADGAQKDVARDAGFPRVALTSFGVIFVAEFGDLTQITTANLAAHYRDPLSVGVGSLLALWAVATLAVVSGRGLLRVVPMVWVTRVAAAAMIVMAGFSAASAIA